MVMIGRVNVKLKNAYCQRPINSLCIPVEAYTTLLALFPQCSMESSRER